MDRALLLQHDRPDEPRAVLTWATGASTVQRRLVLQPGHRAVRSREVAPQFLYSFVFGLSVDLYSHPRKPLKTHSVLFSHIFSF